MSTAGSNPAPFAAAAVAGILGLVLAWAIVAGGALLLGLAVAGAVVIVLTLRRPSFGALAVITIVTLVPPSVYKTGIPFFAGELQATDALIALAFGSWLVKEIASRGTLLRPPGGATIAIVTVVALAIASLATAASLGFSLKIGLLELRPLLALLLVFPLVSDAERPENLERWAGLALVLSGIAAVAVLIRYAQGDTSEIIFSGGGDRVLGAPLAALIVGGLFAFALAAERRSFGGIYLLLGVVTVGALAVSFQRGAWLAFVAGIIIAALLSHRVGRRTATVVGAVAVAAMAVALWGDMRGGGSPPVVTAIGARVQSIGAYNEDVSARHRLSEWTAAVEQIGDRPLTGIGLGGTINYYSPLYDPVRERPGGYRSEIYVHNSYLWLALKIGIPAGLALVLLVLGAIRHGAIGTRTADPQLRPILVGAVSGLVAILVLALTGPHLSDERSTPYLVLLLALVYSGIGLARRGVTRP